MTEKDTHGIAIVGVAGRFPKNGQANGTHGTLEAVDKFDAAFFGISAGQARIMDPQARIFLECAWEALENAGYASESAKGLVGVFAGTRPNTYLVNNLVGNPEAADANGSFQHVLADAREDLASRVASKLNLRGPSLTLQTQNSLAAVCVACQQLLTHQCDVAVAGDVSITVPQSDAPDASDAVAIAILKRASDALADGNEIHGVIAGFALNREAQHDVIALAEAVAGVDSSSHESDAHGIAGLIRIATTEHRGRISAFSGTGPNCHIILQQSPQISETRGARPLQVIAISARTESALENASRNLMEHFKAHRQIDCADAAYTLSVGRKAFSHRRAVVCGSAAEAAEALQSGDGKRVFTRSIERDSPSVAFMFPGHGQHLNAWRELYENEPTFREQVEVCAAALGCDLHDEKASASEAATFTVEYALAKLWMSWGIRPEAMIGHGIGEFVAATLSGVFSLKDALHIISARGKLLEQQSPGAMLAVALPERDIATRLGVDISIAAANSPSQTVVSGPTEAIQKLREELLKNGTACHLLETRQALHSAMMASLADSLLSTLKQITLRPARVPFISDVTGDWITPEQATNPAYWAGHIRQTVRFSRGIGKILEKPGRILLEVGPGQVLGTFARQNAGANQDVITLTSVAQKSGGDIAALFTSLARLWVAGVPVNWPKFYSHQKRRRISLPTYPFERERFWIEPLRKNISLPLSAPASLESPATLDRKAVGEALQRVFRQVSGLDLSRLSSKKSFADLGLDSLLLTQASLAIEKHFGVQIALGELADRLSTLDQLIDHLAQNAKSLPSFRPDPAEAVIGGSTEPIKPSPTEVVRTFPLTDGQKEIWFGAQLSDAASCSYNEASLLHLRGALDEVALARAIQKVIDRHESLRTTFSANGDEQYVYSQMVVLLRTQDVEPSQQMETFLQEEVGIPFDLAKGPLVRFRLLRKSAEHHVLSVTVHHLICDGASVAELIYEICEFYAAELGGQPPAIKIQQFHEFAAEQQKLKDSPEFQRAEKFWVEQFQRPAPVLELPADHARPSVRNYRGRATWVRFDKELTEKLKKLSATKRSTLFTTLLAAYYVWLHRLSGQSELVVGVPTTSRAGEGNERLIGHCINFLPLRLEVAADTKFTDHLNRVRSLLLDAYDHQNFTFGNLLQKLNLARDNSRTPLVSVMFNLDFTHKAVEMPGLEIDVTANPEAFSNFDLSFNIVDSHGLLEVQCLYSRDLFDPATIERWLKHFETLLREIVARPNEAVERLSMLSEAERQQILVEWNKNELPVPNDVLFHELFERQVAQAADRIAVRHDHGSLTYGELNRKANQIANYLLSQKVKPGALVSVSLSRRPELVAALLGIMKAGCAYVPLDPEYPIERLRQMMQVTNASVLITESTILAQLPHQEARTIQIDRDWPAISKESSENPARSLSETDLAYVMFTSGSTGGAKPIGLQHQNAVAFIHWAKNQFTADELAGVFASTSICFDLSVFELFAALSWGGSIILADNPMQLATSPAREHVTLVNTVPSAIPELLKTVMPPSLSVFNLAGEALSQKLVDQLYEAGLKKVYDLYGPTENTTYSTCALRTRGGRQTIGRPLANTEAYILDPNLQPQPIGVPGELFVAGALLTPGYLNDPELTAKKFITHPFKKGQRAYRTGDLARFLENGDIEFLGRIDHQMKLRGYRIEPGEIEAELSAHPDIADCVAILREDVPDHKYIAAYLVTRSREAISSTELRNFLRDRLPAYMIPAGFVFLEKLPRTPNGKIDRRSLPAPDHSDSQTQHKVEEEPFNEIEKTLADIWCKVIGLESIGRHDNFFDLGGHSILITQIISRCRNTLGVELTLRNFFESPTIGELAPIVEQQLLEQLEQIPETEAQRLASAMDAVPQGAP